MSDTPPHQLPSLDGLTYWTPDPKLRKAKLDDAKHQGDRGLPDVSQLPIEDPPELLQIHALAVEAIIALQERAREILQPYAERMAQSVEILTTDLGDSLTEATRRDMHLVLVRDRMFYDNLRERFLASVELAVEMANALILEYFNVLKSRHPHGEILDDAYDPPMVVAHEQLLLFGQGGLERHLQRWDQRGDERPRRDATGGPDPEADHE